MKKVQKIAIMTGGGDCPGLNPVIRAVVKTAISKYGLEVMGVRHGYHGLYHGDFIKLGLEIESLEKKGIQRFSVSVRVPIGLPKNRQVSTRNLSIFIQAERLGM